ncbi:MAG: indolepyruvate ferredoxin oxidoreductase subunit alpha [Candidatus Aenigmatarchaeota archaeon]|nr:MAG: indolepyruvate ferredoxin oxidoreductase subunit alpha [Candidatus Aenigmarchaeota archaeon]
MENPELVEKSGKRVVLLGNEAIARGAAEAGMGLCACYPGTPSSEVGLSLADMAKKVGFYFEWSTNEKVAAEVAAAASFSGVKSMTAMKHFGLNVASDSFLPLAYTGVRGGLVAVVADDPLGHSSAQSEQDTRFYARMGNFPVLEPANAQECKDFTIKAFELSKRYEIPVILRTTTMVSHSIGTVKLGRIRKPVTKGRFVKDPSRYNNLRPNLQNLHYKVLDKMAKLEGEGAKLDRVEGPTNAKIGIIANGVSYNYVKESGARGARIAKLNMTNPISREFISRFLKGLKTAIVVEELEPFIESFVREVALEANPGVKVHGKDVFPRVGEFSPEIVEAGLARLKVPGVRPKDFRKHDSDMKKIKLPARKPVFCPGCPHQFTFKAVKNAMGKDTVWSGDIGCYSIGIFEPYNMIDWVISMGASQGMAHGIKKVSNQKVVAFIGDSTFFHAGMSGLANIIYNKSDPLIIVMDNSITAMTGHQPHPGTGFNAMWEQTTPIRIEDVVKALGVKHVAVINPMNQKSMEAKVREFSRKKGPAVIVSRCMCQLLRKRLIRAGMITKEGKLKSKRKPVRHSGLTGGRESHSG